MMRNVTRRDPHLLVNLVGGTWNMTCRVKEGGVSMSPGLHTAAEKGLSQREIDLSLRPGKGLDGYKQTGKCQL